MTIQEQTHLCHRTNKFIEKYGVSRKWLASKAKIREKDFSCFINQRLALSKNQQERLTAFLDKYEQCMSTFSQL